MENKQHVQLPNNITKEVTPKDLVIYLAIRRYANRQTKEAYPSLDTLHQDTGAAINTIRNCIKRLVLAKKISIRKDGRKNVYKFFTFNDGFEPFSYEFLDNPNLTKAEKLHILCTQQYMFKENGVGKVTYSDAELSEKTGLNRHTISKTNQSLIEKGFAEQIILRSKNPETGLMDKETIFHLNELGQAIVFKLKEHEERIDKHDEEIEELKRTVAELKQQLRSQSNIQQYYF